MFRNTDQRYGIVAAFFHGVIAVLILGLLFVGLYMADMDATPAKFEIYGIHKALGIIVLTLASLRLVWMLTNTKPMALETHARWEKILSKTVHILLYVAMFVMPLSGWIMSSAGGHAVSIFGWFDLPAIVEKSKALGGIAREVHEISAFTLMGIIGLHIAGALKHHIIDHDGTLRRMFPAPIATPVGLMAATVGIVALTGCALVVFKIIVP